MDHLGSTGAARRRSPILMVLIVAHSIQAQIGPGLPGRPGAVFPRGGRVDSGPRRLESVDPRQALPRSQEHLGKIPGQAEHSRAQQGTV